MDILHHNLEAVEELGFGILDFSDEVFGQVFVHDAIAGGKESQDVLHEVALVVVELMAPVVEVGA